VTSNGAKSLMVEGSQKLLQHHFSEMFYFSQTKLAGVIK